MVGIPGMHTPMRQKNGNDLKNKTITINKSGLSGEKKPCYEGACLVY